MRRPRIVFASAMLALGAVSAYAQGAPDFSKVEIKTTFQWTPSSQLN